MTDSELKNKVTEYLQQGRKLDAIKFVKTILNLSLIESKDLVEAMEGELKASGHYNPIRKPVTMTGGYMIFALFLFLGVVFMGVAGFFYWKDYKDTRNSVSVPGKVIRFNYQRNATAPVVEYEWNGSTKIYSGNVFSSPSAFDLDETVEMLVNPDDPDTVVINQFTERYLFLLIFGFIGFVFAFIGGIGVWVSRG